MLPGVARSIIKHMAGPTGEITQLLNRAALGAEPERDRLAELVYADLRRIASHIMSRERKDHTLQPTVLATDAYLRLVDHTNNWENRAHFFAAAAQAIRRILIDHGRKKRSLKRGGVMQRVDLEKADIPIEAHDELLALDEALHRLEVLDKRQAKIVELRYFGGLTDEEVAEVIRMSVRTVKREWSVARAWLYAELNRGAGG